MKSYLKVILLKWWKNSASGSFWRQKRHNDPDGNNEKSLVRVWPEKDRILVSLHLTAIIALQNIFFLLQRKKAFDFPLRFGSLQVMDVCTSFPSRSHALPHLLFPHKNSYRWRREASEGWAWGRAEGAPCSVCFKPLFGEETFIAGVIYERPDSREN